MFIEVPIVCHTDASSDLKGLGISVSDNLYEIRAGMINSSLITGFYPDEKREETIVHAAGEDFTIAMKYEDFKLLIPKQCITPRA